MVIAHLPNVRCATWSSTSPSQPAAPAIWSSHVLKPQLNPLD
jgi:hypothetical protein